LTLSPLDEGQKRDVSKILNAGEHLLGLINDILDYHILGQMELKPVELPLAEWARETADSMRARVEEHGNRLLLGCPADAGAAFTDRDRLRQVVLNLLGNAAKFTRRGAVTLRVGREADGGGDWLRIEVSDTGRGMRPEQLRQLFRPFCCLLDRRENPEGVGLGLALSRTLCRRLGGDITVVSAEGQGSTFTVRVPARAPATKE
jgi:signal transduction histidine kinase